MAWRERKQQLPPVKYYTFMPPWEQCRGCAKVFENCNRLDFSHMPTRRRDDRNMIVWVVCTGFTPRQNDQRTADAHH